MNFNLIVEKRRDSITAIKIVRTDKTRSKFLKSYYLIQLKKKCVLERGHYFTGRLKTDVLTSVFYMRRSRFK